MDLGTAPARVKKAASGLLGQGALALRPGLGLVQILLPGLRALPSSRPAIAGGAIEHGAPPPVHRRPWLTLAIVMVPVCMLGVVGAVSFFAFRPRPVMSPRPMQAALPLGPREELRRTRIVGDQLNLETRIAGDHLFVYVGGANADTALGFANDRNGHTRAQVVSLHVLAAIIKQVFRDNGLDVTAETVTTSGLDITLSVRVPAALKPLNRKLVDQVREALQRTPALMPIRFNETVAEDAEPFLLATLVGGKSPVAFTSSGRHQLGDAVLGQFRLASVDRDEVRLSGPSGAVLVVPLHGDSRLSADGVTAALPSFGSAILN